MTPSSSAAAITASSAAPIWRRPVSRRSCVQRRSLIGGACVTEEPWPGFKVSTGSYLMSLLQPKIILDLELKRHGLEVLPTTPTFAPRPDGQSIVFWPDEAKLCAEFAKFSAKDAAAYPLYRRTLERLTPFIREIIWETPPNVASTRPKDLLKLAGLALKYRKFAGLFYEIYDILTMSAYDYLAKWFESDAVIAALGYYVHGGGTNASMKMPATAFSIRRRCGQHHGRGRRRLRARRHGLDLERHRALRRGAWARRSGRTRRSRASTR